MEIQQVRPGLWRWTAPHPEWRPEKGGAGGWEREVGCVYCESPGVGERGVVLIDPLAPPAETPEAGRFWEALDRDVERAAGPVTILLTCSYHQRSAAEVRERYRDRPGAEILAPESTRHRLTLEGASALRPGDPIPGGLKALEIEGPEMPEIAYFVPSHGALVLGDALIGAGGGRVRLASPSWAEPNTAGMARYRGPYRESLRRLLDLPLEILLVSHGEPVLERGREALEEALGSPAWGEE